MKTIKITLPIKITSSNNEEGDISGYIITDVNDTEYFFLKQEGTEELLYDGICVNILNNMDLSTNELPNGNDFFQNKEQDKENFTQILKNYPELINPNQYDLSDIFEKLKIGRSSDEQEYINDCILKFKNK
jgi:hypothetical protein